MTTKRLLTLAAICILVIAIVYLARPHHRWKQPRVYIDAKEPAAPPGQTPSKEQAGASVNWTEHFRTACPHMALLHGSENADYTIHVAGSSANKIWVARTTRSDWADIYVGHGQDPHAILKDSCAAIRDDVDDWAGFGSVASKANPQSAPNGRYAISLYPGDPTAFLLDTKTGAVWELGRITSGQGKSQLTFRKFDRVSVDGLYTSADEDIARYRAIEESGDSEDKKQARHKLDEESQESERQFTGSLLHQIMCCFTHLLCLALPFRSVKLAGGLHGQDSRELKMFNHIPVNWLSCSTKGIGIILRAHSYDTGSIQKLI